MSPGRPLGAERVCTYRYCDVSLDGRRPQCIYCGSAHKAAENRLKAEELRSGRGVGVKPSRNRPGRPRTRVRDGHGTHMYVLREDIELVQLLLAGTRGSRSARERLDDMVRRARERIEGRAAA